ncbi:Lipopolysaccharide heptosyltransferase 1 [Rosistilla carotiformis]|uniref:Lipopolysaccharide heptosyltransferase 1 n=1 Tax=Rosistilla carotiformis TaxID=2528017 RepID=A0A518JWK8_9BACT|nr:glycosyltransferase family 9 protein [Rosistilla carotiformis]QDV69929.1 Lipopolysaccharide heptosyltransferase 1 [Rosistilla carotiformis]
MSNNPYHILITRLSAIGDCIATMPLAAAIKQAMPQSKITWAVSCAAKQLLDICPDVDRVIVVPKRYLRQPSELLAMRRMLRQEPIDCVLDPQSLTKSAALGWLSGARLRIGFAKPRGRELAPWLNTVSVDGDPERHLIDAQATLLKPIDIVPSKPQFHLNIPDETLAWAKQHVQECVDHPSPVIINPGAGWDSRLWPTERYAEVATWLHREHQIPTLVVWAGDRERGFAEEICSASNGIAKVAGDTSLVQLAAVLKQAKLFLSSDTGPMHLAVAVGTRCLSLHGPTRPELSGPYGPQHLSIQKARFDGSSRERRGADNWSMQAIPVAEVCAGLTQMLSMSSRAAA